MPSQPSSRPAIPSVPRHIPSLYRRSPWSTRLFLWVRWAWTPYRSIAALVPDHGKVLDGGCGHGLLSLALAPGPPGRRVIAIDLSPSRLEAARSAGRGISGIRWQRGDFSLFPGGNFRALIFLDVLHYLPGEKHGPFLDRCFRRLAKGGLLLFREVDRRPGFSSFWNRSHEWVMARLGLTRSTHLHFRHPEEWVTLARKAGFRVQKVPQHRFPFADILFICQKPGGGPAKTG